MSTSVHRAEPLRGGVLDWLNTRGHKKALLLFMVIVVAHWAEHIAQAVQIYALGWPIQHAHGVLGIPFPWLVHSEWLHYGYAAVMLVGLVVLRRGFQGKSRTWWNIALGIQIWHHLEHLLLLVQALVGENLAGRAAPTSLLQLIVPRVELHLIYNALVFVPMVVAMVRHHRASPKDQRTMRCTCALSTASSVRS